VSKVNVFVAADANGKNQGIYRMVLNTLKGTLDGPWLYYECAASKALDYFHFELAAVCEQENHAGVVLLDTHQEHPYHLDTKMAEEVSACHITQDDLYVYTANDREGTWMVYRKDHGKLHVVKRNHLSDQAKCTQTYLLDGYLYVVCSGLDCIRIFDPQKNYAPIKDIMLPKGSGPCHVIADAKHAYLYVLCALSNEVFVYKITAHLTFRCQQIISVLPKGCKKTCTATAVRISPNGKYLYTSTDGMHIITCFEIINGNLRQCEIIQSGGENPYDFTIDETGRWMIVLNKGSGNAIVFQLNPDSGKATMITDEKQIPFGTAIVLAYRI